MKEQVNNIDSQGAQSSGNSGPSLPSYLLEAALDREWERRHRQGQTGKPQKTSPEEGLSP